MNCPSVEQWHLLSMDALDEAQRDALQAHAEQCADCRTAFGRARQDHARLQRAFEVFGRRHDELRDRLMTAVPAALAEGSAVRRRPSMWSGWRNAIGGLSTSPSRIAAILVPAAGLLIALGVWLMPARSTLAFGAVLQHMRVARTMACDYTMTSTAVYEAEDRTEQNEYHGELSMYSDGAVRAWRLNQTDPSGVEWIFPDHSVRIDADGKRTVTTYTEHPGTFRIQETPEWWLARLLQLSGMPDRQLGPETRDGREVVGFEIAGWRLGFGARPNPPSSPPADAASLVRVWADADTGLPVSLNIQDTLLDLPGIATLRITMTWEDIEWDTPLDPASFEPPPPAGEPVEEATVSIPAPGESALLDGLSAYADLSERIRTLLGDRLAELSEMSGQEWPDAAEGQAARGAVEATLALTRGYPGRLDAESVMKTVTLVPSLYRANVVKARAGGDAEAIAQAEEEELQMQGRLAELMPKLQAMALSYRQLLLEDREPEYFGATVTPADANAVLMRWKLDENHQRLIYGDLRAETVTIEG